MVQLYVMHYSVRRENINQPAIARELDIKHVIPDKSNCQTAAQHSVLEDVKFPALKQW